MNKYEELEMEIVVFESEDVITTSNDNVGGKTGFDDLYLE